MLRIKKGDEVVVISGRDKGKRGTVLRLLPYERAVVENVNIVKRHTKPNPAHGVGGGIVEKEASIHVSNIMLYNPQTKHGDRVGVRVLGDGKKVRYFKSNDEVVDI